MKKKSRFTFVRHGQTYANIDQVWHGQTDTELTDQGKYQARQLGQHFKHYMQPEVIYSSPLQRAHFTARQIAEAHNLTVELDPRLMEFHLGDWEGMPFVEIDKKQIMAELRDNPEFTAPNGESQLLVKKRMVSCVLATKSLSTKSSSFIAVADLPRPPRRWVL